MRTNKAKAKLAQQQPIIGAEIPIPSPDLVELSAILGFDFITIDAEHNPLSEGQVVHMIRTAEAFDVTPIVRLPKDPDLILRYLDAGAQGIHVPRCNSAADAQGLVECTRFYPQGRRTFYALGRSANYTVGVDDVEWSRAANRELLVVAMVEEVEALDHLAEILAVPHFDVVHIGPKDLWQSMGMPAPGVVEEKVAEITRAAVAAGKDVSLSFRITDDVFERIARYARCGARMITVSPINFIIRAAPKFIEEARRVAR